MTGAEPQCSRPRRYTFGWTAMLAALAWPTAASAQDLPQNGPAVEIPGTTDGIERPSDLVPTRGILPEITLRDISFSSPCDPRGSSSLYFDLVVSVPHTGAYPIYTSAVLYFHESPEVTLRSTSVYPRFTDADFDPAIGLYTQEVRGYAPVNQLPRDLSAIVAFADPENILTEFDETNNSLQINARELFIDCPV